MRKCKVCKETLDDSLFIKCDMFYDGQQIVKTFYKLCINCRDKSREANNRRKNNKSEQAKKHYQSNREQINKRNKEWRDKNKDKLREYDKSPERKEFHKQWLRKKRQEDPCRFIYYSAKQRSKIAGIIFDISKQDIIDIYPKNNKCPILDLPLIINVGQTKDDSPSLDRLIPEKGYVKGNIVVISHRANRIKSNSTLEELKKIVCFLEQKESK